MSISSELLTLQNTKTAIRTAINQRGGSVSASDTFASYATAIDNLPSGGSGNPLLTSIDVSDFTGTTFNDAKSYITDVTIPSGVTSIGNSAFSSCSALTSLTISNSVTSIGQYGFQNSGLTSITIPSSVTSLGNSICKGCTSLTSATILSNCTSISFFENCSSLTSITLGYAGQQLTIEEQCFKNCTSLTTVTIPSNIVNIKAAAFYGCTSLTSVIVEATTPPTINATTNGGAFGNTNNCPIYVPSASVDAYKAANNWSTYADRIYPIQQVATVDGNPVYNYEIGDTDSTVISDTERDKIPTGDVIEFAEGVTQIGGQLGAYEEVVLPSTFTSFNDTQPINAATTTLTSKATTPPSVERSNLGGSGLTAIYVPAANVADYQAASGWSSFASIIQPSTFAARLYDPIEDTTEYVLCEDLAEEGVFGDDELLTLLDTGIIGELTFGSCVDTISWMQAEDIATSVVIPDNVTSISSFANCGSLESATLGSGITSLPTSLFAGCGALTSVNIPSGVTTIQRSAFEMCQSLDSITIPNGVTTIRQGAFYYCIALTSIDIPNSVTTIQGSAMPFENGVFQDCSSLETVTIGTGITTIGQKSFYGCSSLESVTINATTPPTLSDANAFDNTNDCPIYVPAASVSAYQAASGWSTLASRITAIQS